MNHSYARGQMYRPIALYLKLYRGGAGRKRRRFVAVYDAESNAKCNASAYDLGFPLDKENSTQSPGEPLRDALVVYDAVAPRTHPSMGRRARANIG